MPPIDWLICAALLCAALLLFRSLPPAGGCSPVPASCPGYDGVRESLKVSPEVF